MWFVNNFTKTSSFDHNNQGLEFQMADNNPTGNPNANAAGKAPTGVPSYQPNDGTEVLPRKKGKKNQLSDIEAVQFLMGKLADVMDSPLNQGGESSGADTLVTQLKWTNDNGSDYHEGIGDTRERKFNAKKFAKFLARKK